MDIYTYLSLLNEDSEDKLPLGIIDFEFIEYLISMYKKMIDSHCTEVQEKEESDKAIEPLFNFI